MEYRFLNFIREKESGALSNGKMSYSRFHVIIGPASRPDNLRKLFKISIQECVDRTIIKAKNNGLKFNYVGVKFSSVLLNDEIHIPIRKISENSADIILNDFENILDENKILGGLIIDEPLTVTITGINKRKLNRKRRTNNKKQYQF